jgi:hypothetical protein
LASFRESFPNGIVLSRQTGLTRAYGFNPYGGYLARTAPFPSFFAPKPDARLRPMERVVGVAASTGARAFAVATVAQTGVFTDRTPGGDLVVFWQRGTRSVLDDANVARGRDVGSTGVFVATMGGRRLGFQATGPHFRDRQTGSTWTILGVATAGPLKGQRLQPLTHVDAFWFAWAGFHPDSTIGGS